MKYFMLIIAIVFLSGCDFKPVDEGKALPKSAMKCGAGKCGANMFDTNSALDKKKKNILSQMKEEDPRKDCVTKAKTTKAAYDCVRDPETKKLTIETKEEKKAPKSSMKCGGDMKCAAGKCGNAPKKAPAMKCGEGKCG